MVLSLPRPILRLVCLAGLRTAQENFSEPFSQKETTLSFFFLLYHASPTCSMPRQYFFCTYLLPNHVKYYLNSQNLRHFKTQREKLCNDDVNRAPVL